MSEPGCLSSSDIKSGRGKSAHYEGRLPQLHASIYDTQQPDNVFDPDGGRWVVTCDEHNTLVNVDTLAIAHEVARERVLLCMECQQ